LYYRYFPMWRAFFSALGVECVLSAPTTKATVRRGTELGENELCLPVKIFFGHVAELDGKVDYIFIPRVVSVEKRELTCPKFLGLPDMTRALGVSTPVLAPTVDMRRGRREFAGMAWKLARQFGASPVRESWMKSPCESSSSSALNRATWACSASHVSTCSS
jgi:predicted nucleotide-binding protein (sugar kinase/HSP70/actin superfamily)